MTVQPDHQTTFSFAVISDTHLNQNDFESNSPFDVNRLANRRLRYVIDDLNSRDIDHVIHLGDVVHPVPANAALYESAAQQFFEQIKHLEHPIHLIPGNHDVGDKLMAWSPAGGIREHYLECWSQQFGADRFSFEHKGIAFIGINAQLLGSGLAGEQVQRTWLEQELERFSAERKFLFSHYPPFLLNPEEDEHYDNLSSATRSELLELIETYEVEALFTGHVHHFWYNTYSDCDMYLLPSTAFTRQDYSEMFRVSSDQDFGRNDRAKLGYLIVNVHDTGHDIEFVRCHGHEAGPDAGNQSGRQRIVPVNSATNQYPLLGFDLRQDWLDHAQIPPTGGLDEFDRKTVRNDYPLLALWEMGAKNLRIPLSDLTDEVRRKRLRELKRLGFSFTLFSYLPPNLEAPEVVLDNADIIDCWEIAGDRVDAAVLCKSVSERLMHEQQNIEYFYSPIKSKQDIIQSGQTYYHVVNHGFTLSDFEGHSEDLKDRFEWLDIFTGVVLRCSVHDSVESTISLAQRIRQDFGFIASVHLRLSSDNPADFQDSEEFNCTRLVEAIFHSWRLGVEPVFCDTFADNDRGYFPRIGLLDREFNPRSGAMLVRNLHALMSKLGFAYHSTITRDQNGTRRYTAYSLLGDLTLLLPGPGNQDSTEAVIQELSRTGSWLNWKKNCLEKKAPTFDGFPMIHYEFMDRRR